jgi:8-oxo-dGTP pyrophosphatase MutT (NUDIX family)
MRPWQTIESKIALENPWITVRQDTVQLPDGHVVVDYNVIVERDVACVVALTPERRLLLCEQYKHAIGEFTFEMPGGILERDDSDPETAARRELLEETGYSAGALRLLGAYPLSPARLHQRMYLYLALDVTKTTEQQLDATEEIRVHALPLDEVRAMLRDGRICAATSVAGIYRALDEL